MSILSTLNKLTGKKDRNVLAALNSPTGKAADDIEEAVGNLSSGGGGVQIEKYSKVSVGNSDLALHPDEKIGTSIYDWIYNAWSYSAITLNDQHLIEVPQSSSDPHHNVVTGSPAEMNQVTSFPVGAVLSTEGYTIFDSPDYDKLQPPRIFKVDDDGIILSHRPWNLNRDPIYYTKEYNDGNDSYTSRMRYFDIPVPDIAEDEIAVYGFQISD